MKKLWIMLMAAMCVGMAQAQKTSVALTSGGDMESENTCVMIKPSGQEGYSYANPTEGIGKDGTKGVSVTAQAGMDAAWHAGINIVFNQAVQADDEFYLEFDYRATSPVTVRTQAHGEPGQYNHWNAVGNISFTEEWQHFEGNFTVTKEMEGANGMQSIAILVGQDASDQPLAVPTTFYLDNVRVLGRVFYDFTETGTCGSNLTWTFTSKDHTLRIAGTGEMDNMTMDGDKQPWRYNREYIQNIVIEEGVTCIGEYAFRGYDALTTVSIPSTVNTIKKQGFAYCTNLTNITLQDGLTSIGAEAFTECAKLDNVTLPNSLTTIETMAFFKCANLANIVFSDNLEKVEGSAFGGNAWIGPLPEGVVYAGPVAYFYKGEMPKHTNLVLKPGTKAVAGYAFSNSPNLISVELPKGLTYVGDHAFAQCYQLTSLVIPASVKKMDTQAFYDCWNLHTITSKGKTPAELGSFCFNTSYDLYVPIGSKQAYIDAPNWERCDIIEKDFDEWVDTHIEGDVNGDGVVDKDDLDKLVEILLGLTPASPKGEEPQK